MIDQFYWFGVEYGIENSEGGIKKFGLVSFVF